MKNLKDLHNLSVAELNNTLVELKEELFNLRFRHTTGQLENPLALRTCKRNIARVKTALHAVENKA